MKNYFISKVKFFINRLGYEIIPTWRKENLFMSETLTTLFESKKINCVLDVGGNKGQYRDFLRYHVGYKGLIITFEPVESNFKICQERSQSDENWIVLKYALGNRDEKKEINIMKTDQFTSFLKPSIKNTKDFEHLNQVKGVENVEVRQLDTIWEDLKINDFIIYLKMDTQGYDIEVVKGVRNHIDRICALQTEASVISIYDDMYSLFDSTKYLNSQEFDISGMFPVCFDSKGRVAEFDVIMINRNL
jgi:FkbM family methyltransferase